MERSYYAIIPADVRYDADLSANAKLLYGEITALCNDKGYCWATNDYFAKLYGVSKTSISVWVSQLIKKGYLYSEIEYKENTKEIVKRYLKILKYPIKENLNRGIKENLKDNNTYTNNTINNIYSAVIDYLNQKTKQHYKASTPKTKTLINARVNEGFTLENFKQVIDKKTLEWQGTKMEKYLRPETLFGTKFEGYLNQKAENLPTWFGKDIKEEMTNEQQQLEQMLSGILK